MLVYKLHINNTWTFEWSITPFCCWFKWVVSINVFSTLRRYSFYRLSFI